MTDQYDPNPLNFESEIDSDRVRRQDIDREDIPYQTLLPQKTDGKPHIAIWGTNKAGKTTFMVALYSILNELHDAYRWIMVPEDDATADWARVLQAAFVEYGLFPPNTQPGVHRVLQFAMVDPKTQVKEFHFTYLEAAGEMFENPRAYSKLYGSEYPVDYLLRCDGLLVLLDSNDFRAVTTVLDELYTTNNNQLITIPMIFALSKCDLPDLRSGFEGSKQAEALAYKTLQRQLAGYIASRVKDAEWCATSAIGFEDGKPPNLFRRFDGRMSIRDPRLIRPRNVAETIERLADKIRARTP